MRPDRRVTVLQSADYTHLPLDFYLSGRNSIIVIDVVGSFLLGEVDESLVGIGGLVHQGQVSQHGAFDVGEHRPGGQFRGRVPRPGECGPIARLVSSSHYKKSSCTYV